MSFLEWLRWATRRWPLGYYWWLERKQSADKLNAAAQTSGGPGPWLDHVCPYCGTKHQGYWKACSTCKATLDSGDSR